VVFILGLGAALALAVGFVLQQRAASQEPPEEILSPILLLRLMQRPMWLAGIGAMVVGQLLGAGALDLGSVSLVEPLLAANLLFALPMSAAWQRRRLGLREWAGAFMLSGGLAGFVVVGHPHGGTAAHLAWPNWIIAAGGIAIVVSIFVTIGKRLPFGEEATMLALAAGMLYGLQDALTRRMLAPKEFHFLHLLTGWPLYALAAVAVLGLLLAQSAFEAAPLAASLPAITVAEPVTGIAFGVGVYGERITLSPVELAMELLAITCMVVGVLLVARSPLVSGAVPLEGDPGAVELANRERENV